MKIRIISDLHIDINAGTDFSFKDSKPVDLTLICGDIGGSPESVVEYLNQHWSGKHTFFFCGGNHVGYNYEHSTIQENLDVYRNSPVCYNLLENDALWMHGLVVVGGTMWTDYSLGTNGDESEILQNILAAKENMNDYRFGLTPQCAMEKHKEFINLLDRICNKAGNKKVIVMSHHAPSPKSIPAQFQDDELNPCYAVDLEHFIRDRPNIVLWAHGHIHSKSDYMIGNCRVVANPYGYHKENIDFDPDMMVEVD